MSSLHHCLVALGRGLKRDKHKRRIEEEARWDRLRARPDDELPAALDRACAACARVWGEALEGFFDEVAFSAISPREVGIALVDVERFVARLDGVVSSGTRLADIYQLTRSLSAMQWQGAFFTPSHCSSL